MSASVAPATQVSMNRHVLARVLVPGQCCMLCDLAALHSGRRLLDAVSISSVRDGPDDSSIAVDLVDASSFVPEGTADASAADATVTATQVQLAK